MSRKLFLSVSMLALTVAGLMGAAPQVSGQVFIGTPVPPQFAEGVRKYYERLGSGR